MPQVAQAEGPEQDDDWAFCWSQATTDSDGTFLSFWLQYKGEKFWVQNIETRLPMPDSVCISVAEEFRKSYQEQFTATGQKIIDDLDPENSANPLDIPPGQG